jgi:hypothetical protein
MPVDMPVDMPAPTMDTAGEASDVDWDGQHCRFCRFFIVHQGRPLPKP